MRDAVLGRMAAGSSMPAITHLYLTTDMAAEMASRLLQLAASANHDVHLHISKAAASGTALQQSSSAAPDSSTATGSSSKSSATSGSSAAWLSAVFSRWTSENSSSIPLQRVTSVQLDGIFLDHPLPLCIGGTCKALKSYTLRNITWPPISRTWIWPHLEQLALIDVCPLHMPHLFCPESVPQLRDLHVSWSQGSDEMQRKLHPGSTAEIGACFIGLCDQLTSLSLEGIPWCQAMYENLDQVFPQLSSLRTSYPMALMLKHPFLSLDFNLSKLIKQAPNIEQLHIGVLHLNECLRQNGLLWDHVRQLKIDAIEGDVMDTLARMPTMPALKVVSLPVHGMDQKVVVGQKWVSDVGKVLNSTPVAPPVTLEEGSSGDVTCSACRKGMLDNAISAVMSCCSPSKLVHALQHIGKTFLNGFASISSSLLFDTHALLTV